MKCAELCLECINKLNRTNHTEKTITLLPEKQICDGCYQNKQIVAFLQQSNIFTPFRLVARRKYFNKMKTKDTVENEKAIKKSNEIWEKIYTFQEKIPTGFEVTEDNAKSLGLMIVTGMKGELLFIDKDLSNRLFAYRISH